MLRSSGTTIKWEYRTSASSSWYSDQATFSTTEDMFSLDHMPLNTDGDDGGPWYLVRTMDQPTIGYHENTTFRGQFVTHQPSSLTMVSNPSALSDSALDSFGTTAIARVAPTNPSFSLSTAVGELAMDGFPMVAGASLFRERARVARSAGSEYLNVQFGWLPLLNDVRSFAKTVKQSQQILDQYRKDSGNKIRRRFEPPAFQDTKVYQGTGFRTSPSATNLGGRGTIVQETLRQQWFSGAFKYHIPTGDSQLDKFQEWASMSDHLLGWKVTPETLWNIAPWSWAVDWFTNCGDVMTNISALGKDGLVMQYGYSMSHRRQKSTIYARHSTSRGDISLQRTRLKEYKQRKPATPFGFGTNLSALTPRQIAITAALGLSRT